MSIRLSFLLALALALALPASATPPRPPEAAPALPTEAVPVVAPAPVPAPVHVLVVTTLGEFELELDPAAAPATVENFLAYARDGHYNGTIFHRVVPGLLLQAGAFTSDLQQKPSRAPVASEAGNGLANLRGTVAAARDRGVADSATAQFFVNLADNPDFDRQPGDTPYTAGYAVFGRVLHGMDVIDRIAAQPTGAQGPFPGWVPRVPVVIERVDVLADTGAAKAPSGAALPSEEDPAAATGAEAEAEAEAESESEADAGTATGTGSSNGTGTGTGTDADADAASGTETSGTVPNADAAGR